MKYLLSDTGTQAEKNMIPIRKKTNEVSPTIALVLCLEVLSDPDPHREIQAKLG